MNMINIKTDSLEVKSSNTSEVKCTVERFESGSVILNKFAMIQFFEGSDLHLSRLKRIGIRSIEVKKTKLIIELVRGMLSADDKFEFIFDYSDLTTLREFLEARIEHCEIERDKRTLDVNGNPKFNADVYVGQKLLLLDLRELMIGKIVDVIVTNK